VDRLKTPLLVMHGGRDVRAPSSQHQLLITELRRHNKVFEEHVYEDEAHGFSSLENRIDMYQRLLTWFDRHLKST
jgi:dipeptidyl aminopeptidase/acylaminoacyl peptidase